jgi:hypothetical protein
LILVRRSVSLRGRRGGGVLLTRFDLALLLLRAIALVLLEELRGGRMRLEVNLRARFASNATDCSRLVSPLPEVVQPERRYSAMKYAA